MEWIKRNLLFVVGSVVALVLMGLAAYYLVSGSHKNDQALEQLNAEYALLERLNNQNPHPGDDKTDNIAAAKQQKKEVGAFIEKMSSVFEPINPIPDGTNVNNAMFAGSLRKTIDKLQSDAAKSGVQVPTNFYFSFTAVRDRIMFDRAGLPALAAQLGEVKAICDVLIDARVNALDAVRRERVSVHDYEAQQAADYLMESSVTNEIAILAPYEVTFRCFSSELADTLAGFASSPHGLIVRAMNVEPAVMSGAAGMGMDPYGNPYQTPMVYPGEGVGRPYTPPVVDPGVPGPAGRAGAYGEYEAGARYGAPPVAGGAAGYGGYAPATPYGAGGYAMQGRGVVSARGGLPTMLDEKQIKVTMMVQVVKLTERK